MESKKDGVQALPKEDGSSVIKWVMDASGSD